MTAHTKLLDIQNTTHHIQKAVLPLINHYNAVSGSGNFGLAEDDVAVDAEPVNYLAASCN